MIVAYENIEEILSAVTNDDGIGRNWKTANYIIQGICVDIPLKHTDTCAVADVQLGDYLNER